MNEQQEELFDSLAEIDGGLIEEAYKIDNAKKLRRYSEDEKGVSVTKIRRYNMLGRVAVAVACLCLAIITVFNVLPRLNNITPPTPGGDETPGIEETPNINEPFELPPEQNPMGLSEVLIESLNTEITSNENTDAPGISLSSKLNLIKNGYRPILVEFDSSQIYYVCAYFTPNDDHRETDSCCRDKYTWIKYENANEILEYYNGEKLIKSYVIDKVVNCRDISASESDYISFEYCRYFKTDFFNGINCENPKTMSGTHLFLCESTGNNIVYNPRSYDYFHRRASHISCEKYGEDYYASVLLNGWPDVEKATFQDVFRSELYGYSDYLAQRMKCEIISERYDVKGELFPGKKRITYKCIFKIEDLVEAAKNKST